VEDLDSVSAFPAPFACDLGLKWFGCFWAVFRNREWRAASL